MDIALHDNDISTTTGDIAITNTDTDAIAQAVSIALKTFAGEWFLDTNAGVPYLSEVFGRKHSPAYLRRIIVPAIESVSGVAEVIDFSVAIDGNRNAKITFNALLTNGAIQKFNETIGL